ncbi:MAG: hypothetical protein IJ899_20095 [Blautia sp.]|nr:hypothetical protein [Blautia sp.]
MKKRINRIMPGFLFLFVSIALLLGATMAYFSDRANIFSTGKAGSIQIEMDATKEGKKAFSYDQMNDFTLNVRNKGNKSMDIKVIAEIESNMPIVEGFNAGEGIFVPCYRFFDDREASYDYTFITDPLSFTESAEPSFLIGEDISDPNSDGTTQIMQYEFTGTLNGHSENPDGDREIEDEGREELLFPMAILFPRYEGIEGWNIMVKSAYYKLTIKVYGKQARNTGDEDWALLETF